MKYFLITTIAILFLGACQQPDKGFSVKGSIRDYNEGTAVLKRRVNSDFITIDSIQFTDGSFTLKGNLSSPEMCYLWISDTLSNMRIFIENADITLNVSIDSLRFPTIKGSSIHDAFEGYNKKMQPFDKEMRVVYQEYLKADRAGEKEKSDELEEKFDAISETQKEESIQFVKDNSSSVLGAYLTWGTLIYELTITEMEELLNGFSPEISESIYVESIRNHVNTLKKVDVGQPMTDIVMVDTLGNLTKLSELKGKIILVDFWASWCGPCRRENPNVVKMYNEFKDKNFEIFGVSFDDNGDKWKKAIQDDSLTWIHVSDLKGWKSEAGVLYGVRSIPHTVLIDTNGIIVAKNLRGDALKEKVAELIKS